MFYDVRPTSGISREFLREIWFFRRLVWLFIWREIVIRYKNTLIGAAWYIVQPLAMMVVFTLVFGSVFSRQIGDLPYPLFAFSGLLLWQLFSRSLTLGAQSLVMFQSMLGKIYFPRIIAPASFVLGALFDFFVTCLSLAAMMAWYGRGVGPAVAGVLVILTLSTLASMGWGCLLAAIDARYRDVRHALPLLVQVWMFCSPVMYPISYVAPQWRLLYAVNPMVGLIEWFRWLLFQVGPPPGWDITAIALVSTLGIFVIGVTVFQKVQGTLVDTL